MVKEMDGFQTSIPGLLDETTYDIGPPIDSPKHTLSKELNPRCGLMSPQYSTVACSRSTNSIGTIAAIFFSALHSVTPPPPPTRLIASQYGSLVTPCVRVSPLEFFAVNFASQDKYNNSNNNNHRIYTVNLCFA